MRDAHLDLTPLEQVPYDARREVRTTPGAVTSCLGRARFHTGEGDAAASDHSGPHSMRETVQLDLARGAPTPSVFSWHLPTDLKAAATARRLIRLQLAAWNLEQLEGDACLITSELVTNALLHAQGSVVLTARLVEEHRLSASALRIEVQDQGLDGDGNRCVPLSSATLSEHTETGGRGLHLVAQCAEAWGDFSTGDGHTVWADLRTAGDSLAHRAE